VSEKPPTASVIDTDIDEVKERNPFLGYAPDDTRYSCLDPC
jgi:hypothetical protein